MSRTPKYSSEQILDAAQAAVGEYGVEVTLLQIASNIQVPIGSIYHRFGSRDELLASLWIRAIKRWHMRLFQIAEASENPNETLIEIAVETARYCRAYPDEARAMTLYRQTRLLESCPPHLYEEVRTINDEIFARIAEITSERYPDTTCNEELVFFVFTAVNQLAYGLVRPYIGSPDPIPTWMDEVIRAASNAALSLRDI